MLNIVSLSLKRSAHFAVCLMILLVQSVKAISWSLLVLSSLDFSFLGFISDLLADLQVSAFTEFWSVFSNTPLLFGRIL